MFSLFKNKERDNYNSQRNVRNSPYHSNNSMFDEDEGEGIGVLIQFTPVATYLYINRDGFSTSYKQNGFYELQDMEGNAMEVFGNIISTQIDRIAELDHLIKKFRLEHPSIPLIKIEVEEF